MTTEKANIILEQMGGINRLRAMINLRDALATDDGVRFRFSGCQKANVATVDLNLMDTYDVALWQIKGRKCEREGDLQGIYADQLAEVFEGMTGLRLSI